MPRVRASRETPERDFSEVTRPSNFVMREPEVYRRGVRRRCRITPDAAVWDRSPQRRRCSSLPGGPRDGSWRSEPGISRRLNRQSGAAASRRSSSRSAADRTAGGRSQHNRFSVPSRLLLLVVARLARIQLIAPRASAAPTPLLLRRGGADLSSRSLGCACAGVLTSIVGACIRSPART